MKFIDWMENFERSKKTMIMHPKYAPDVQDILAQAANWVEEKKSEGWTREDFQRELLAPLTNLVSRPPELPH